MPTISGNALITAIQAVHDRILSLQAQIDTADADDPGLADLEDELLACSKSADELRIAYEDALKNTGNLPPNTRLLKPK